MTIPIGIDGLLSLIKVAVQECFLHLEQQRAQLEQAVYTETEAAAVLRLKERRLKGERVRGRIKASEIVRGEIRYSRQDILEYLLRNRINDPEHPPLDGDSAGKSRSRSKKKAPPVSSPTTSANGVEAKPSLEEEAAVDRESMPTRS